MTDWPVMSDEEIRNIAEEMTGYAGWRWDKANEQGKEIYLYRARHIVAKAQLVGGLADFIIALVISIVYRKAIQEMALHRWGDKGE